MLRLRTLLKARFLFRKLEGERDAGSAPRDAPAAEADEERKEEWPDVPAYFRCRSCGGEHPAPIQFLDREAMLRTHLTTNVFRCPVRKLSARYTREHLIWRDAGPGASEPGAIVRMGRRSEG